MILRLACCLAATAVVLTASTCASVDIPVSFTLSSSYTDPSNGVTYTSGIRPDNGGTYINGVDGVKALIHVCNGSNGTTLNTATGPRTLTYDLRSTIYVTSAPSWTNAVQTVTGTWFNFANLLPSTCDRNTTCVFTTYLKTINFGNGYYFGMENPAATAPSGDLPDPINSPCVTSLVNVKHIPATTNPNTPETWIVWADSTPTACLSNTFQQVGSLFQYGRGTSVIINGQYRMPFYMTIQRLQ